MSHTRSAMPSSIDGTRTDELTRPRAELAAPDANSAAAANPSQLVPGPRESVESTPRLVVLRGADSGSGFALTRPRIVIGRHKDSDVVLEDVTVSRQHAELVQQDGRTFLIDGGSLNGTYVNRQPVDRVRLVDGDEIWIGKVRFAFREDG